ncbi:MAG: hypothetical protein SF028_03490 [Candidatus Sumerlaeia bacterium]|nr:hypothetical protein [Candidatus Sumerlaeia bacterium]
MKTLAALIVACCLAHGLPGEPAPLENLREAAPGMARERSGAWLLRYSGPSDLLVPPPALTADFPERLGADSAFVLEADVFAAGPAQVHARTSGDSAQPTLQGVRRARGAGELETLRWRLDTRDGATSATLSIRPRDEDSVPEVRALRVVAEQELGFAEALDAYGVAPVMPTRTWTGLQPTVPALVFLPSSRAAQLDGAELQVLVEDGTGASGEPFLAKLSADSFAADTPMTSFSVDVPAPKALAEPLTMRAAVRLANGDIVALGAAQLGVFLAQKGEFPNWHEMPIQSIEDFSAFVWNGELFLATMSGPPGTPRRWSEERLPATSAEVALWKTPIFAPLSQIMALRERDPQTGGGFGSPSVIVDADGFNIMAFTAAAPDGAEALAVAAAANSTRMAPSLGNPVFVPGPNREGSAAVAWRGNAMLPFRDGLLMLSLSRDAADAARVHALAATMFTSWMDLGPVPAPVPEGARWLSAATLDSVNYLLAGPEAVLLRTTDPLRAWEPVALTLPEGWGRTQLLEWNGKLMAFGLRERFGRGVVEWSDRVTLDPAKGLVVEAMPPPPAE